MVWSRRKMRYNEKKQKRGPKWRETGKRLYGKTEKGFLACPLASLDMK
jgi:hypothetical protein